MTEIKSTIGIEPAAHLTCLGHTRGELSEILDRLRAGGVENVLCLRGDPPRDSQSFPSVPGGFRFANELVGFVRKGAWGVSIGAACYPEGHLENPSREDDLRVLKLKVEAGSDYLITQLFFDNAFYFDFVARARAAGITVPIIPGIMPITTFEQIDRMTRMCGATIPCACAWSSSGARRTPRRCSSWAWRTPPCSAWSCSSAARPASTSTRSTDRARRG